MMLMIGARWHVTLIVREVMPSPVRIKPPRWRLWFAPPAVAVEEIAARRAMRATLTREREQWVRDFAVYCGGMTQ